MPNIGLIDMMLLDDLFEMNSGYVLNFSDRTFSEFFANELAIDIDADIYRRNGTSKGKRLRCFLQTVDKATAARTLRTLWDYREALRLRADKAEAISNAHARLFAIISQLEGGGPHAQQNATTLKPAIDGAKLETLKKNLIEMANLKPQARGYAFEQFLKDLFDIYGLEAREPFKLRGEQIDGSFQLSKETYLLEAKWQGNKTGVGDLHAFHGKVEGKAAWARGLFVAYSGFTEDGLHAFGRGKRVICMDGFDLYEVLNRGLSLTEVLELKVRRAAESGLPFIPVRELFPG